MSVFVCSNPNDCAYVGQNRNIRATDLQPTCSQKR